MNINSTMHTKLITNKTSLKLSKSKTFYSGSYTNAKVYQN